MISTVVSQNYGRGQSVADLTALCKDVRAFKHKVVNLFAPEYTSGLFTLKSRFSDHLIEEISGFEGIFPLNASPYKQFRTNIEAAYCHTSKQRPVDMEKMTFRLDQMQTNAAWEKSFGRTNFFGIICNEKALRIGKEGRYSIGSSWFISLRERRSELSSKNDQRMDSGTTGLLSKMFSSHAVKFLPDPVAETMV